MKRTGNRTKTAIRLGISALFLTLLMGMTALAAPSVARKTEVYIGQDYNSKKQQMSYRTAGTIVIKGANKSAKITDVVCSNDDILASENYGKDSKGKKRWEIFLNSEDVSPNMPLDDFTVSFTVKQGGKKYQLSTTCHYAIYKPFKSLKINGKNVLKSYTPGYDTVSLPLAGKKLSVSCKLKKGFKDGSYWVQRKQRIISNAKNLKLKKGDLITISYAKKSWRKGNTLYVIVK